MTLREPLSSPAVKKLIRAILSDGTVGFTKHAREEMAKDKLVEIDVVNVLRGGVVEPGEWENGSWRYRVRTARMVAVIAFRSESALTVVTAWRLK
ncbi:MAG: hypothetical protein RLZZ450_7682 [Pseudomonadota bacterium]|jgi:hypothetical protein